MTSKYFFREIGDGLLEVGRFDDNNFWEFDSEHCSSYCALRRVNILNRIIDKDSNLPRDVTDECEIKLTESQSTDGVYAEVIHEGKSIMAFDIPYHSQVKAQYSLWIPTNSAKSFRIIKER